MRTTTIPEDYEIVLSTICLADIETYNDLADSLAIERPRLAQIVDTLQRRGLIFFRGSGDRGFWVRISAKGRQWLATTAHDGAMQPSY